MVMLTLTLGLFSEHPAASCLLRIVDSSSCSVDADAGGQDFWTTPCQSIVCTGLAEAHDTLSEFDQSSQPDPHQKCHPAI